jgi:predicted permease
MRWLHQLAMKLRTLFARRRSTAGLDAELLFHLDRQIEENLAAGMKPEEARYAALRAFGNPALLRDQTRAAWSWGWMERLAQDLRFAARQILRAPGFALIAILTLALGIGANTAIFTLTHALLLESLPVADPQQLVRLAIDFHDPDPDTVDMPLSVPMIESFQKYSGSFSGVFGWSVYDLVLQDGGISHGHRGAMVSGNAFNVLGLRPAAGRLLSPSDDQPGGGPDGWAAVISYRLWLEQYHADPSAIGRHVVVTDHPVTIVGVAPPGFEGVIVAEHPDLYLPVEFSAALNNNEDQLHQGTMLWLTTFARLKPGVSLAQAGADAARLFPVVEKATLPAAILRMPETAKATLNVESARTGWSKLRLEFTRPLLLLQALVGVVLLLCCANLSGLFLARASARRQEFAIRASLGAGRARLMRQLLVESLMLALPGALAGIGLSWLAGPWMLHGLGNTQAQKALSVRPDVSVLLITAACTCLCALLFGMAPAWMASRTSIEHALRASNPHTSTGSAIARRILIPLQLALSLSLVVVAALLGSTVVHLRTDDTGFRTRNVIFYIADFGRLPQKGADLVTLYRRILQRMEEQPGVDAASVVEVLPYYGWIYQAAFTAGDPQHSATIDADFNEIGAHYFAAVGTPLLAGRDLRNDDADLNSCIVSRSAAAMYFPRGSALGKVLHLVRHNQENGSRMVTDFQVVGIVADTKYDTVRESPPPLVYLPFSANSERLPGLFFTIHARSLAEAGAAYRTVIHEEAPLSPETDPATFDKLFNDSVAREQLLSSLSGFFAVLALLLSGIGIYGLVAWNVSQRTMEIGVRMALGATRIKVFLLILRQTTWLLAAGLALGGVGAILGARSVSSFLYETHAGNPGIFLGSAAVLVAIGLVAAMLPARRAVGIDPMKALRTE